MCLVDSFKGYHENGLCVSVFGALAIGALALLAQTFLASMYTSACDPIMKGGKGDNNSIILNLNITNIHTEQPPPPPPPMKGGPPRGFGDLDAITGRSFPNNAVDPTVQSSQTLAEGYQQWEDDGLVSIDDPLYYGGQEVGGIGDDQLLGEEQECGGSLECGKARVFGLSWVWQSAKETVLKGITHALGDSPLLRHFEDSFQMLPFSSRTMCVMAKQYID
ncbi:hypothetical protein Pmani_038812 [Petrolisthes manimaculis]|uniref:Uncharacterized protein n=1 Tax=Petrolisthes manimaculis TaxID=1843537 RepID=A0AAE1NDN6_9EUCA|nr:hypothetical protein Pmani_038812 [Petrolisthes manimaculis]